MIHAFAGAPDSAFVVRMLCIVLGSIGNQAQLKGWLQTQVKIPEEEIIKLLDRMDVLNAKVCLN
jgi:hypothetical protein